MGNSTTNQSEAIKYLREISESPDELGGIHSSISESVYKIITNESVKENSFALGLFGKWGSGKSFVLRMLNDKVSKDNSIAYLELDVWKYVDDSLYRSILFNIDDQLRNSNDPIIKENFKDGFKYKNGKRADYNNCDLVKILEQNLEFETNPPDPDKSRFGWLRNLWKYIWSRKAIFITLVFILLGFIYFYLPVSNFEWYINLKNSIPGELKALVKLFYSGSMVVIAIGLFQEYLKDFLDSIKTIPKRVVMTSLPTFAQDQFEDIFNNMISQILKVLNETPEPKVVIVFDNLDRCDSDVAYKTLTGLKTFLDVKNCFYVIPCDDKEIQNHIRSEAQNYSSEFMDKIFQTYLRIPPIQNHLMNKFFKKCLEDTGLKEVITNQHDISYMRNVMWLAYEGKNARQIKRFFNDFISLWHVVKIHNPILLDDIKTFTFILAIKQKWPNVESIILSNPQLIYNFIVNQDQRIISEMETILKDKFPNQKDIQNEELRKFSRFISQSSTYLNSPDVNLRNYIYISESKWDSAAVVDILIRDKEVENIDQFTVEGIDQFIRNATKDEDDITLETSIITIRNLVQKELEKSENEEETSISTDLFNTLWRGLAGIHNRLRDSELDNRLFKKLIPFFTTNLEMFSGLGQHKIHAQKYIIHKLKTTEFSKDSLELFNAVYQSFPAPVVAKLFTDIVEGELKKYIPYAQQIEVSKIKKYLPVSFINTILESISFTDQTIESSKFINYIGSDNLTSTQLQDLLESIVESLPKQSRPNRIDEIIAPSLTLFQGANIKNDVFTEFESLFQQRIGRLATSTVNYPLLYEYLQYGLLIFQNESIKQELRSQFINGNLNTIGDQKFIQYLCEHSSKEFIMSVINEGYYADALLQSIDRNNGWNEVIKKIDIEKVLEDANNRSWFTYNFVYSLLRSETVQNMDIKRRVNLETTIFHLIAPDNLNLMVSGNFIALAKLFNSKEITDSIILNYLKICISNLEDYSDSLTEILSDDLVKNLNLNDFFREHMVRIVEYSMDDDESNLLDNTYPLLDDNLRIEFDEHLLKSIYNRTEDEPILDYLEKIEEILNRIDSGAYKNMKGTILPLIQRMLENNRRIEVITSATEFLEKLYKLKVAIKKDYKKSIGELEESSPEINAIINRLKELI